MTRRRASIRQPLLIYAIFLTLATCLGVLAFSGVALKRASERAYRRAVREELRLFARAGLLPGTPSPEAEVRLGLVSTTTSALGVDLAAARALAQQSVGATPVVVVPIPTASEELYLVARTPRSIPTSIALVELSRIMPWVLFVSLAGAGLMAVLVYRQLLPSLRALAEFAEDPPEKAPLQHEDAPNEIVEIALRFRDTTRLLRAARERAEAQRDELEQMQSSLIRASKLASVGRLAAGIAHEIGNPLAAVKGYLSLMQDGLPEETRRDVTSRSLRELERIHLTIEKLLTYARTGSEQDPPVRAFSIREPLDEALALARGHPAVRHLTIEDEVDDIQVVGVPGAVGQVLVNLVLNAGQAAASRVRLYGGTSEDGRVELRVEDDGPGIPPRLHDSVFDPFFTTKAPGEGTGLGLAVSRAMLERMGGGLELDTSTRGTGACFAVRLPRPTGAIPPSTGVG